MLREINHGSIKFIGDLGGDALGKLVAATFSSQEDHSSYLEMKGEITTFKEESKGTSEITNRRLDLYHFYFSSKL